MAAAAAAIEVTTLTSLRRISSKVAFAAIALLAHGVAHAAVLPDDRADVLYHRYDGGGVTIDGPSVLLRKKFAEKYSVSANYYMDMVSSASIDVMTTASPYTEERTQGSLAFDLLQGKTQYSVSYTLSDESDYTANTASFDLSQDIFGDLVTVSFGFSQGWDEVRKNGDNAFEETVDRRNYRFGVQLIVTPRLMTGLNYEAITDEGFLNNPYRSVRYLDETSARGFSFQPELYPHTRTSNAVAINARYFLPHRASVHGEYRYFTDTWGIDANTASIGYTHPWGKRWIFEAGYRWYDQSAADFYSDLFPRADAQNFLARDKELSTFTSHMFSLGATYELSSLGWDRLRRSTVNLFYDRINFQYDDFRDITAGGAPGTEELYGFDADVFRLFVSGWF
ncbi:MAG: porin [Proteobacteria bacterium]|nr:porin [Pseudomonadota bacterium]